MPILGVLLQHAEGGDAVQAGSYEPLVGASPQQLDRGTHPEAAVHASHAGERLACDQSGALGVLIGGLFAKPRADVADAAACERLVFVSEVAQHGVVTAAPAVGPAHQLEEQVPLVLDDFGRGGAVPGRALGETAPQPEVGQRMQHQAQRRLAVASGATHLLVVGLDRARGSEVHHGAHVRAVDAHAEGVRGHHHVDVARVERTLCGLAPVGAEPGVVAAAAPAATLESPRFLLGVLAREGVDDGGAAGRFRIAESLRQRAVDGGFSLPATVNLARAQGEVRPREAVQTLRGVRRQAESLEDLVTHHRSRRRRARDHARAWQRRHQTADLQVVGPEVVPPLADAVGFIDGDERTLEARDQRAKPRHGQPFRRHVDQRVGAAGDPP